MTRAEVIKVLQELWRYKDTDKYAEKEIRQALSIAIKALEQADKITEIIEPLRHMSIDEMSNIEWQILRVIDGDKALEQEPMPTMVYPQVDGITPTVVRGEENE